MSFAMPEHRRRDLAEKARELIRCCRARAIGTNDTLFNELAEYVEAQEQFTRDLMVALRKSEHRARGEQAPRRAFAPLPEGWTVHLAPSGRWAVYHHDSMAVSEDTELKAHESAHTLIDIKRRQLRRAVEEAAR